MSAVRDRCKNGSFCENTRCLGEFCPVWEPKAKDKKEPVSIAKDKQFDNSRWEIDLDMNNRFEEVKKELSGKSEEENPE